MIKFLKKSRSSKILPVDVHSHLLPAVDDGVQNFDESLAILTRFSSMGYKKVITTPHIMHDYYDNKEEKLKELCVKLNELVAAENIDIQVEVAAEYYLDDYFYDRVKSKDTNILTFGDNYLLFETPFMNEPLYLDDFIFITLSQGFKPILAHPERYAYLSSNIDRVIDLHERGTLYQLNISSFSGYYSKPAKKLAEKIVDLNMVDLLGSDCHNMKHLEVVQQASNEKYFHKALNLPLINYKL